MTVSVNLYEKNVTNLDTLTNDSVKYLCVFLDEKLSWNIFINKKLTQGYSRMRILYPLINFKSTL